MLIEKLSILEIFGIITLTALFEAGIFMLSFKISEDEDKDGYMCAILVMLFNSVAILTALFTR